MNTALPPVGLPPRGRPVHGAKLGIIMLDTLFQRFPGDIGNAHSFDFPVQYAIVRGIRLGGSVRPDEETLRKFFDVIDLLVANGVDGISTSCGFLAIMQPHLAEYSPVPVASSSLMQIPMLQRMLPKGKKVGVLTANKPALTPAHFEGAGVSPDLPVAGMPLDGAFRHNLVTGNPVIDRADHEREVLQETEKLLREHPDIGALVFECTNLSPFSEVTQRTFGLPVYDIITLLKWFHGGLQPTSYV